MTSEKWVQKFPRWQRVTAQIWVMLLIEEFIPFFEQKIQGLFKDFQGHFSHFWRTPFNAKKSLESVFFSSSTTWVILSQRSFCVCSFLLEFYLSYKVSIEIQGLSSTNCNFQGLSRQDFQGACEPCDLSCRMANLLQPIRSTTQIWVVMRHQFGISVLVSLMSFHRETSGSIAKRQLFSHATNNPKETPLNIYFVM